MSGAPGVGRKLGMQTRWVQRPTMTAISGLTERLALAAYSGCCSERRDFGSANRSSCRCSESSISAVRRNTNTGWPRHSTVWISPGLMPVKATSTGPPMARARSLARCHRRNKGHDGRNQSDACGGGRCREPQAFVRIDGLVGHGVLSVSQVGKTSGPLLLRIDPASPRAGAARW